MLYVKCISKKDGVIQKIEKMMFVDVSIVRKHIDWLYEQNPVGYSFEWCLDSFE